MAIDTENKRRSAQSYGGGGGVGPRPDGALDEFDRRHVAWVYRGPLVPLAVWLFRAPVGASYRLVIADLAGRALTELRPRIERVSWVMGDVGSLRFAMAKTDEKLRPEYLRFGNRVYLEFDNGLRPWGGVITGAQEWSEAEVGVEAVSGEQILRWRLTGRNLTFAGATAGAILQAAVGSAEAVMGTGLAMGVFYMGGEGYSPEYHYSSLWDVAGDLMDAAGVVVDVRASLSGGKVLFTLNLFERMGVDRPGVALVEGANVVGARLRVIDSVVNGLYGAGDGSGWDEGSRVFGALSDVESIGLYDLREGFESYKTGSQSGVDAALRTRLALSAEPARAVGLQVANRPPGEFGEYDLGDAVTVVLPTYGFEGTQGLFQVLGREFFPAEDVCDLLVREVV